MAVTLLHALCLGPPLALLLIFSIFAAKSIFDYIYDPLDLRKYPAPNIWAAIFPFWLMRQTWKGRRFAAIHEQHQSKGDIVRLSPTYLVFNIPQAVTDIYGHGAANKIKKATFYDTLAGEFHDIVQVTDRADHARKRRFLASSFALKNVVRMEPIIRSKVQALLEQIDRHIKNSEATAKESTFDFRHWFNYFTLDVIGHMGFGLPPGFLNKGKDTTEIWNLDKSSQYTLPSAIYALIGGLRYHVTIGQDTSIAMARFIKKIIKLFPSFWSRLGGHNGIDFENFSANQLRNRLGQGPKDLACDDFVQSILKDKAGEERNIPFMELVAESTVIMAAGSATTTGLLTSSLFLLLSNPRCLSTLRKEIDSVFPYNNGQQVSIEGDIIPYDKVKDLPYLRACIDEALRVRPPISIALPRLVYAPEGVMIAGHHIRQGTTVAVSPWTIHRNETIYPAPQEYRPERWISDGDNPEKREEISNLKAYNIPFSQGSRACIGRHIAVVEAQILLATLIRRYDFSFSQSGQELSIFEAFNANPGPLPIKIVQRASVSI